MVAVLTFLLMLFPFLSVGEQSAQDRQGEPKPTPTSTRSSRLRFVDSLERSPAPQLPPEAAADPTLRVVETDGLPLPSHMKRLSDLAGSITLNPSGSGGTLTVGDPQAVQSASPRFDSPVIPALQARERVKVDFERQIQGIAAKANETMKMTNQYYSACYGQTTGSLVQKGRRSFEFGHTFNEGTPFCRALLRQIQDSYWEIRNERSQAIRRARGAGLLPGEEREILHRYNLFEW